MGERESERARERYVKEEEGKEEEEVQKERNESMSSVVAETVVAGGDGDGSPNNNSGAMPSPNHQQSEEGLDMSCYAPIRVLSSADAYDALHAKLPYTARNDHYAMYSPVYGGIVTDPALMVVPLDDHMVNRGHAVFDTCNVMKGKAYGLDFHLERLCRSARQARIDYEPYYSVEKMRWIVLSTIAASGKREGVLVRMWLTAGRGNFSITPSKCPVGASFYVVVHEYQPKAELLERGIKEVTVPSIAMKCPLLATMKSNNYLINALCAMEAEDRGGHLGIQFDENGNVGEFSIGSLAIVDSDNVLRTPTLRRILRSTTLIRASELAPQLVEDGVIKSFEFCELKPQDLCNAKEIMDLGGGGVVPIVELDGVPVGNGRVGPVVKALAAVLRADMLSGEFLDDVPYDSIMRHPGGVSKGLARFLSKNSLFFSAMIHCVAAYAAYRVFAAKSTNHHQQR